MGDEAEEMVHLMNVIAPGLLVVFGGLLSFVLVAVAVRWVFGVLR
jgi:hypothetical protein